MNLLLATLNRRYAVLQSKTQRESLPQPLPVHVEYKRDSTECKSDER